MIKRPLLYIAGPYTNPDPVINTHFAAKFASAIFERTEWVPVLPHPTLVWHMVTPRPIDFWYDLDLHHMVRCDAVTRLPGASSGADNELRVAAEEGMTIVPFESFSEEIQAAWLDRGPHLS